MVDYDEGGLPVEVTIRGNSFRRGGSEISPLIAILSGYEEALSTCIRLSGQKERLPAELQYKSMIKLRGVSQGSLVVDTVIWAAAALAPFGVDSLRLGMPVTKELLLVSWDLFVKAKDLIVVVAKHFLEAKEPIHIELHDSPNAIVQVVRGDITGGNKVVTTQTVYDAAKSNWKDMKKIASTVEKNQADDISFVASECDEMVGLERENAKYLLMPSTKRTRDEEKPVSGHIYRINTKTKKGLLELVDDAANPPVPFQIMKGPIEDYVDSLKEPYTKFIVREEVEVNALGESKVTRLFLEGIDKQ